MAPDINSLPPSPRQHRQQFGASPRNSMSNSPSRRASQQMPPPPVPISTQNSQATRSPTMNTNEATDGFLEGPLRHPRPMTAAELFAECEKEQEAVVNRLSRELTALRAQSASVASNASHSSTSTSASLLPVDISDPNPTHQLTGATHPTPRRRRGSSSSLSTRSIPNTPSTSVSAGGVTNVSTQSQAGSAIGAPHATVSQASADRAAAAAGGGGNANHDRSSSRPSSISASGRSTPAQQHPPPPIGTSHTLPPRPSLSRDPSFQSPTSSVVAHAGTPAPLSPTQSITTPHYADTAAYRSELENVKAENEALRQRVRALERALRSRRRDSSNSDAARSTRDRENSTSSTSASVASTSTAEGRSSFSPAGVAAWAADPGVGGVAPPRERSESQSTTTSSRRGLVGLEDSSKDDVVRVGESAAGVGRGG